MVILNLGGIIFSLALSLWLISRMLYNHSSSLNTITAANFTITTITRTTTTFNTANIATVIEHQPKDSG